MSLVHQNWWFTTLLVRSHKFCPPLSQSLKCDVLIVGGGVSGISAAAEFVQQGKSVVLIERNIVGGGSAGRSAGFLTPDSELELHQLVRRYGAEAAREIWDAPLRFPSGKQMQCWDSKLVYSYWRLTGDNRMLLGGGTAITTFLKDAWNNPGPIKRVIKGFKKHFPFLRDLPFIQFWPGLIDTTRDLLPIIVKPPTAPHLQFILGVVGLPWASFAGSFAARNILRSADEDYQKYYRYFSNRRHFTLPAGLARLIGKPMLFSLTNGWAKFYQVDSHRETVAMKDEF